MLQRRTAKNRRVLLISYFFPPFQSVGALRISKLTKHLPRFGWRPTVLTVDKDTLPRTMPVEIPESWIERARNLDVNFVPKLWLGRDRIVNEGMWSANGANGGRLLARLGRLYRNVANLPDGQIGWLPAALRRGDAIIRKERPEVIYSSALPATSHLIAAILAGRHGLPWIAEFRDPWTDNPNYDRSGPLATFDRFLEKHTMARATRIVAVTPQLVKILGDKYGRPAELIPNGFDPEDRPTGVRLRPTFTISFTGMAYPSGQSVAPLFEALRHLRRAGELPPGLVVRLVGRQVDAFAAEAKSAEVADLVEVMPQQPRDMALRIQAESTVLLLPLWTDAAAGTWYPAKMFEYMGVRRPILAIGPSQNEAAELLRSTGAGEVAQTSADLTSVLRRWFADFRRGGAEAVQPGVLLENFRRERIVEKLATVLDATANSSSGALLGHGARSPGDQRQSR